MSKTNNNKHLKRYIEQLGGEQETKKLCNKDREFAFASLISYRGIGPKIAERILQEYRSDTNHHTTTNLNPFQYLRRYVSDAENLELLDTLIKKCDKLQGLKQNIEIYNKEQFENDTEVVKQEIAYIFQIVGENAEKMKKKYATYTLKLITCREAQENKNRKRQRENKPTYPQPQLRPEFVREELNKTPYEILKKCKLSFQQIDELSIANKWWEIEGFQRAASVIHESWIILTGENNTNNDDVPKKFKNKKCTACTPDQLLNVCAYFTTPSISKGVFISALEELIEKRYYIAYENSEKHRVITSKKFFDLETNIFDFVNYYDDYYEKHTTEELLEYIEDAKKCLDSNITLTSEQISCILLILQNPFSIVNAIGGELARQMCVPKLSNIS